MSEWIAFLIYSVVVLFNFFMVRKLNQIQYKQTKKLSNKGMAVELFCIFMPVIGTAILLYALFEEWTNDKEILKIIYGIKDEEKN